MLKSMTAFGRAKRTSDTGDSDITVELRSVNSRYLDCTVKLPRAYSAFEEKIKLHLTERGISRGKLEVYVGVDTIAETGVEIAVDPAVAGSYINALRRLRDEFGLRDDITVMSVAQNRDIFITRRADEDTDAVWRNIKAVLDEAIDTFVAAREREGESLKRDLLAKLENLRGYAAEVASISENDIKGYSAKLEARIKQFLADFDVEISEQRILTEAAIFADRAAIDEELVRLNTHFAAFVNIIDSPEPAGRRLDFLLQEMNRETNTIGSKANNTEIAHLVVNMKSELEKIREQIQNIE